MSKMASIIKMFAALALVAGLTACDSGGVGTQSNPNLTTTNTGFVYAGPAARNIDVSNFQYYLYKNVNLDTRCGGCHNSDASTPVSPFFFDTRNVNVAYDESIAYVDLGNPLNSEFVNKLNGTHSCWEPISSICGTLIAGWIEDWKNAANGGVAARQINLTVPASIRDPGDAKSFPSLPTDNGADSFAQIVYPILVGTASGISGDNCQGCHSETAAGLQQAPFFASGDVNAAYEAAKSKMNIDTPKNSRLVVRVRDGHNFWSNDQIADADRLQAAIEQFADAIDPTKIDVDLVTSKALTLPEGIIASGGNRHETDQFAIWEFKTGTGRTAFDTSGLDPAIRLSLIGSVDWVGGFGLEFTGGRAQADTMNSDKLYTYIQTTDEYAIEAWVIPANVSQENTNIVSYSAGDTLRNFTLSQTLYDYESYNRIDIFPPKPNGDDPILSTGQNTAEIAQASLQHVVVNYDPFAGRSIYVNGELVDVTDTAGNTTISNAWDDTFAFVLGAEIGGSRAWAGQVKMVAMHNRALTPAQILQNFDVGVGQKFFLLFYVGHQLGEDPANPQSFVMFEVAQFDSYSYLFDKPTFINLDPAWVPGSIAIEGLRIGINGKEALAGQAYANIDVTVEPGPGPGKYDPFLGQELSPLGTIIALDKGPGSDEFFLTFEVFGDESNGFTDIRPLLPADPADPPSAVAADIGVRTFEEINSTIAAITGVPVTNAQVRSVYRDYFQQLPSAEDIGAFLPSHQMAIAQLALTSCSELVEDRGNIFRATYFPVFNFDTLALNAFNTPAKRALIIDPLLNAVMNVDQGAPMKDLTTQPDETAIGDMLGSFDQQHLDDPDPATGDEYDSLITHLLSTGANDTLRTRQVVKAVCAAVTGGAVMLVQ